MVSCLLLEDSKIFCLLFCASFSTSDDNNDDDNSKTNEIEHDNDPANQTWKEYSREKRPRDAKEMKIRRMNSDKHEMNKKKTWKKKSNKRTTANYFRIFFLLLFSHFHSGNMTRVICMFSAILVADCWFILSKINIIHIII